MAEMKVELNRSEVGEQLLKSDWIAGICSQIASEIMHNCGEGYTMDDRLGRNRVNARVYAETTAARKDNINHNTLLKAMGAVHD